MLEKSAINGWLSDSIDTMAPGTLNSMLGSLTRLLEYLMDSKTFRREEKGSSMRMVEHIKLIRKSMKKRLKKRKTVIQTEEIRKLMFILIKCKHKNILIYVYTHEDDYKQITCVQT